MTQKPRILLIDDNEVILDGLKSYLTHRFDVVIACDGLAAKKAFDPTAFDLIITDLIMPAVCGLGLIAFLKERSPRTPIIAMTGWGQHSGRKHAATGADALLRKPFELEELEQCMSKLLVDRVS